MSSDETPIDATSSDGLSVDTIPVDGMSIDGMPACASGTCSQPRYQPLHPELFGAEFRPEWLAEPLRLALIEGTDASLRAVLEEEVPGRVFSFEMLDESFCARLLAELKAYEASGLPVHRPNTMNNYGVIVNQIGMKALMDSLQRTCVQPLARLLFPREGAQFTAHHSFMVNYEAGKDLGLDMHHDDSDVTLNVCLGKEFTGATLTFCGGFGSDDHRRKLHVYTHRVGRGVIHLGTHRHGADDIVSGERFNLIMCSTGTWPL